MGIYIRCVFYTIGDKMLEIEINKDNKRSEYEYRFLNIELFKKLCVQENVETIEFNVDKEEDSEFEFTENEMLYSLYLSNDKIGKFILTVNKTTQFRLNSYHIDYSKIRKVWLVIERITNSYGSRDIVTVKKVLTD